MAQSLPPDQLAKHRSRISFEVKAFLKASYFEEKHPHEVETAILSDWCDELQDWEVDQIKWALRQHRRSRPDKRPNPAHILAILIERRGHSAARRMAVEANQEPPPPRATAAQRAEQQEKLKKILGQFGRKSQEGNQNDE